MPIGAFLYCGKISSFRIPPTPQLAHRVEDPNDPACQITAHGQSHTAYVTCTGTPVRGYEYSCTLGQLPMWFLGRFGLKDFVPLPRVAGLLVPVLRLEFLSDFFSYR